MLEGGRLGVSEDVKIETDGALVHKPETAAAPALTAVCRGRASRRLVPCMDKGHSESTAASALAVSSFSGPLLGYQGHSRIARFVIGNTAQKVNAYSKASVLIVKPTPETEHLWYPRS